MSRKIVLKVVKNLLFLSIGIALLYLAFRDKDINELIADLKGAEYSWVFLSLIFSVLAYVARAARWIILLEPLGYKPRFSSSLYTVVVGYFANLAIPRIGEITRCTTMSQAETIPVDKLFGTVILERIIDLIILMSLTLSTILLKVDLFGGFFYDLLQSNSARFTGMLSILGLAFIIFLAAAITLYIVRSRIQTIPFIAKIQKFIVGLKEGLISIRKIKNLPGFLFYTFLIWFCYYVMTWVVFYAMPETSGLGFVDALFILVVGGFGMTAPVQGGIGAYHFIVRFGLVALGVESNAALSYATIVHTSQTLLILVFGSFSLIMLYFLGRSKKLKSNLA